MAPNGPSNKEARLAALLGQSPGGRGAALPPAWEEWARSLQSVLADALLPLFILHFRRGQRLVPVASLAASLEAAGACAPVPGAAAAGAAACLAEACPDFVAVRRATGGPPQSIELLLSAALEDGAETSKVSPATCCGIVAKGYSLAIPQLDQERVPGVLHDPQGKRWARAQGQFYVNLQDVEKEIAERKPEAFGQLVAYAKQHASEEPIPFEGERTLSLGQPRHAANEAGLEATAAAAEPAAPTSNTDGPPAVLQFLDGLRGHDKYKQQICHVETYAPRPAQFVPFDALVTADGRPLLSESTIRALQAQLSIEQLFSHQHRSLQAVLGSRQHLCLTTGTSSGKSLAFALPILEDFRRDPTLCAIILFPTKALAQDQLGKLQRLFYAVCPELHVCTFDGDTPKADRPRLLKECHVFLSNPDMLHYTILANHRSWRRILENLRYVVLDEAHIYRATFGSHVALLLRRLRRVLHHYSASPTFIACSATMCNPAPFFRRLVGLDCEAVSAAGVTVVDDDTAGRGERQFCLWNPPQLEQEQLERMQRGKGGTRPSKRRRVDGKGNADGEDVLAAAMPFGGGVAPSHRGRTSAFDEAAWVLAEALRKGLRTVCFLQCRSMVELVVHLTSNHLEDAPALQRRLATYRGGYTASERRRLEQQLFTGELLGVVATNALELGIDIGDLDATIHVGVPPTVASVWQQAGRAGRRGRPSVAVLVAHDAPLEQHFCRNPSEFFQRTVDTRLPDVSNAFLLRGHTLCATVEMSPLTEPEASRWLGAAATAVLQDCRREGRLVARFGGRCAKNRAGAPEIEEFVHCQPRSQKSPKEEVNLRDIDPVQFQVKERGTATLLENAEQAVTFLKLYPGAIYLHQMKTFFVQELDLEARIAWVVQRDARQIDYYTECRDHSSVVLLGGGESRVAALPPTIALTDRSAFVKTGPVKYRWSMYGFKKKAKSDHRVLDKIDLSLPTIEYPTRAAWMDLPDSVLQPVAKDGHDVDRGGLHALEHAMIAMAPLCCDLESSELTCQHSRGETDANRFLLLLYETQKGGAGSINRVYDQFEELLRRAVRLIEACPCDDGCPNCIIAMSCGEHNHGLDKVAALKIGRALGLTADAAGTPEIEEATKADEQREAAASAMAVDPPPPVPQLPASKPGSACCSSADCAVCLRGVSASATPGRTPERADAAASSEKVAPRPARRAFARRLRADAAASTPAVATSTATAAANCFDLD